MSFPKNSGKYQLHQTIILYIVCTKITVSRLFFVLVFIKDNLNILKYSSEQNMNEEIDQRKYKQ